MRKERYRGGSIVLSCPNTALVVVVMRVMVMMMGEHRPDALFLPLSFALLVVLAALVVMVLW